MYIINMNNVFLPLFKFANEIIGKENIDFVIILYPISNFLIVSFLRKWDIL